MRQSCKFVSAELEREDGKTHVDERINTTVLDHAPGVLSRSDVRLAVQGNVNESIAVEELDSPLDDGQDAAQDAEDDPANHTKDATLITGRVPGDGADSAQELDDGDHETAEAD